VTQHRIVVHQDSNDDWPWVSIECDWGDDPQRPCKAIDCPLCLEEATAECLDLEHGASLLPGCGVQEYVECLGTEGIVLHGLEARAPVANIYFDYGWHLECGDQLTLLSDRYEPVEDKCVGVHRYEQHYRRLPPPHQHKYVCECGEEK
jgi:hypothetical protein